MGIGGKHLRLFIVCFLLGIGILFFGTFAAIGYIVMTGWNGIVKDPVLGCALLLTNGGVCVALTILLIRKIRMAFQEIKR